MTLSIRNLSQSIKNQLVLSDVSFEVNQGEIVGVFETSETKRSELIKLIAGNGKLTSGEIWLDSIEVTANNRNEFGIAVHSDDETSRWQRIFRREVTFEKAAETKIFQLEESLRHSETLLLLDCPFDFVDRQTRDQKIEEIKTAVSDKNLAAIIATDDFEEVFSLCDRVLVFENGKILQEGTPREVYENPRTVSVLKATGRSNVITAKRVSSSKSETPEFITIDGEHRVNTDKIAKSDLAAINQDIFLAIRPEHISISFGASFPEDNLLKAEITSINYLGATTLLHLDAGGLSLQALVLRLVGLNVGDQCMVGLPPDRILVLNS